MTLTPPEIVAELNKHIIGQEDAKRAVAIALRDRWRRLQLPEEMRAEVKPKNILLIGPTGVGKTEIARRLAKLAEAPFIKVEATKYTEVGYVGRDVESIIRDLVDVAFKQGRERALQSVKSSAQNAAEERVLDALLPPPRQQTSQETEDDVSKISSTRELFRKKLQSGKLDEKEIEIEIAMMPVGIEIMAPPGMEEMSNQLQSMFQSIGGEKTKARRLKIKDAMRILQEEEAGKLINEDEIKTGALENVEQNGIVFIDELDKVASRSENRSGGEVSREGVQRDLLPLIEGCTVFTKFGMVKTDHVLFIASGAFHVAKPSDLIPELQGRLPIRVELSALSTEDFVRILTEPDASLTKQYIALMGVEGVTLNFTHDGIEQIAKIAWQINENVENIGARRLHTVIERLLQKISYEADQYTNKAVKIDGKYVSKQLVDLVKNRDLSEYIL